MQLSAIQGKHAIIMRLTSTAFLRRLYNRSWLFICIGISVSSMGDGVLVLHMPIEDKGDKVCLFFACVFVTLFGEEGRL